MSADFGNALQVVVDGIVASKQDDGLRTHLGASVVGKDCMREVWFSFHWTQSTRFEGRMLRLFERGQREEEVFVSLLKGAGASVWTHDANGKQFLVSLFGGHYGGSCDGEIGRAHV